MATCFQINIRKRWVFSYKYLNKYQNCCEAGEEILEWNSCIEQRRCAPLLRSSSSAHLGTQQLFVRSVARIIACLILCEAAGIQRESLNMDFKQI